jgi:hypothetical protein
VAIIQSLREEGTAVNRYNEEPFIRYNADQSRIPTRSQAVPTSLYVFIHQEYKNNVNPGTKMDECRCINLLLLPKGSANIVACLLRARTVEPEEQPLLVNGSETTSVVRQ